MQYRKLNELKKLPNNPRIIRDKQFKTLCDSIRDNPKYFEARPIILSNRTGEMVIIAGNQRYEAAKFLKLKEVPTFLIEGLTEAKEREIVIRDNISNGEFDMDALANAWGDLPLVEWGVDLPDDWLVEEKADPADAEPQIDKAAELNKIWKVKTGDLWQIGEHRLVCGDCTDKAVVDRVMGGETAGAVVTDSPYGINREGVENDDPEGLRKLFDGCLAVMPIENAVVINFQSPRLFPVWLDALRDAGQKFERALWWREIGNAKPWRGFRMQGECILVSSVGSPTWDETRSDPDTFDDRNPRRDGHPTQKPTDVIEALTGHTTGIVYDPFLGSGTTMVACQNLNRKCRGIEISPAYCAVILQRMFDAFPNIEIKRLP